MGQPRLSGFEPSKSSRGFEPSKSSLPRQNDEKHHWSTTDAAATDALQDVDKPGETSEVRDGANSQIRYYIDKSNKSHPEAELSKSCKLR